MRIRRLAVSAMSAVLMATGLCAAVVTLTASPALANACTPSLNGPDERMSRGRALARAQAWVDAGLRYDSKYGCSDPSAGNVGGSYRLDCSGLVSMAWGLNESLTTWQFQTGPHQFAMQVHEIALDDLRPGDAIIQSGHMELFVRWKDTANHGLGAYVYSFNRPEETVQNPYALSSPPPGKTGQLGFNDGLDMQTFQAIRYNNMIEDEGTFATTYNMDDTLRVAARGSDGTLRVWGWPSPGWQTLGGSIVGNPTLTVSPDGNLEVFARGANNHLLQWAYIAGSGWVAQPDLGGSIASDPVATYFSNDPNHSNDDTLQIFARGTDNTLRRWAWSLDEHWLQKNENLSGSIAGSPAAITDGSNALRVVAVGTDGTLRHWGLRNNTWLAQNLPVGGTNLVGDPAVTISRDRAFQVIVRANDNTLRHFAMLDGTWPVVDEKLYGSIAGNPAVTNSVDGTIQVVARGTNGYLQHRNFVWGVGWGSWTTLSPQTTIYGDVAVTNSPSGNLQIYAVTTAGTLQQWHFNFHNDAAGPYGWGSHNWGGSLYHG